MKVKMNMPLEIDLTISYEQAINILTDKIEDIARVDSYILLDYNDNDEKIYVNNKERDFLTKEQHKFVGSVLKLVKAYKEYEKSKKKAE